MRVVLESVARTGITVTILMLAACGGTRTPAVGGGVGADSKTWFCQMASKESWDCVQDADPSFRRKRDRVPTPAAPEMPQAPPIKSPPPSSATPPEVDAPISANVPAMAREEPAPVNDAEPASTKAPDEAPPPDARQPPQPERPMKLSEVPGEYFAVQLVALDSIEAVEAYVEERNLRGMSAARIARDDRIFYVLLLGVYADLASAEAAIADLPPTLGDATPWIRPMRTLQAAMRRADAMQP